MHVAFILLHIYKEALFLKMNHREQNYENALKNIRQKQRDLQAQLAMIKNPSVIAAYAQNELGMQPITLSQIRQIS